jgi:hypothetical protein
MGVIKTKYKKRGVKEVSTYIFSHRVNPLKVSYEVSSFELCSTINMFIIMFNN